MQVLVLSAGRSGTNLLLECMTGHSYFIPTDHPVDYFIFTRDIYGNMRGNGGLEYPDKFLTKCDIVNIPSYQHFHTFMQINKEAYLLWTIRHPYDWALSKMYSGRKRKGNKGSADSSVEGCKFNLDVMFQYLNIAETYYPDRILRIKMEDVILNLDSSRINLYKNINTAYGGYFIDKIKEIEEVFEYIKPLVKELEYKD